MAVTNFAAIHIGSYDVSLEIYEISRKYGIHCIDRVVHHMELGRDSFTNGKIGPDLLDELCTVLKDFVRTASAYRVKEIRIIATSALREAQNDLFVLGKIQQTTGLAVQILSNSEQRFLSYKAIASMETRFNDMIRKGTVIVDLGGGSVQMSVFDNSALITTQNLRMGSLRIRERLQTLDSLTTDYEKMIRQLIRYDLKSFKKMYLKDRKVETIILNGDFLTEVLFSGTRYRDRSARLLSRADFEIWYKSIAGLSEEELAVRYGLTPEFASLFRPSAVIYHQMVEETDASLIWFPGTHLTRGLAYEFADENNLLKMAHNFGNDIITAARNIAKRYSVGKPHIDNMDRNAQVLFDATESVHGMKSRDRLLLRIAVMLHDVGKYISFNYVSESSFNIIMSNEIIGLSHAERECIALSARYMTVPFPQYEELVQESSLNRERYLKVAYFVAILRYVNTLDRSHMQKVQQLEAKMKDQTLLLKVTVNEDFTLERGLIREEAEFFTDVFGLRPEIKVSRVVG